MAGRIDWRKKAQTRGRSRRPRLAAIAPRQQFADPGFRLLAAPHRQQRADDVAHHVMQERIGLDVDDDAISITRHADRMHIAMRRARLTGERAECAEIVFADQCLAGALHRRRIQRLPLPGDIARIQRRPRGAIEDRIAIAAPERAIARMEVVLHAYRPAHGHRRWQARIGSKHPATFAAQRLAVEMHDLAERMHAGIGAPGTGYGDRMIGDKTQRLLDHALHGRTVRQALPAEKVGAVVFNAERDAHRGLRGRG